MSKKTSTNNKLTELRADIDAVDTQLLELISERARLAQAVAHVKNSDGSGNGFYRPEREAQILRRVMADNGGPLPQEEMARLFREIMSACLALEQPLKIAYLGPEGTFTQLAALKHFGHSVHTETLGSIDQVFREVEAGACHYGVVPIENSIEGVVNHTLDMLIDSPLKISGEVELRIHHHLLGNAADRAQVKRVYSHQQSLAQCRRWLDENLLDAERVAVSSNAEAARRVAAEPDSAAIAGEAAAEIYELGYLARNIEDHPDNTTRFLVIGRHSTPPSGDDKTSLLVSGPNRSGLLFDLIKPLAGNGINMTRLESRPSRQGLWDYVFFIDILGHAEDPAVASAMRDLGEKAGVLKLLGSYPRAVL
ncbi:chorismate mutase/prephenate dehydratase [Methylohalomonas lacus]|uniref:Bifunctional chorismate mutase/prephenate dehydratase n=1 Tax=Methylohalomonas lacus TaxID=398773 RepID=A0AAE3HHD2_9GAMM|nr:prephenate dehydratase [Methylohalomonas lacus]MCS3902284.1 chorismate mutase/prephenate dehydratase [Methylohalomonas lacus]